MIEIKPNSNAQAELIAANVFLDHFGYTSNNVRDRNSCDTLRTQISEAERSLNFEEKNRTVQAIKEILDNHRQELSLPDKQIYYLQLQSCIKNEEAKWKKNAVIIALFCAVFFAAWIYLNAFLFLYLPPTFFLLGFQIILTLNLLLIKGLKTANVYKDSLETELFYNHVTIYKEIALALKQIAVEYYHPASDLDEKTKINLRKLLEIVADIMRPQNTTEIIHITQNIWNHRRYLARILAFLLNDPEARSYLWIFDYSMTRRALALLLNRVSLKDEDPVKEQENKADLLAILQDFAEVTGNNPQHLQTLFENKRWHELFDILLLKA